MNKAEQFFTARAAKTLAAPDAFKQFLEQKPPEEIVGYAKDSCQCPIATFAKSLRMPIVSVTFGHVDIELGRRYAVLGVDLDGQPHLYAEDTESWFVDFVGAVDRLHLPGSAITARRALAILKAIAESDEPYDLTEAEVRAVCL